MHRFARPATLGSWAALLTAATTAAHAETADAFYTDKQVKLVVSSGAGGGYDAYARLLARHLVKYLPGTKLVIQNMPGAAGLAAINYTYNIAEKDGSYIADAYSTMPLYPLLDGTNAKFDAFKLNWLGSISRATSVCVAWHTAPFKTLEDAMNKTMRLSSTGATGWRTIMPRVYNEVGGTKFEIIMGYTTGNDLLAIERGEVDGGCITWDALASTRAEWIKDQKLTYLAQMGVKPLAALKGVPMGLDRIKNSRDREAAELILSQQETGRPYVMPPGVPSDRVEFMRAAFTKTMSDPEYLAESEKSGLLVDPLTGAEVQEIIKKAYATNKETVDYAKAILERASTAK